MQVLIQAGGHTPCIVLGTLPGTVVAIQALEEISKHVLQDDKALKLAQISRQQWGCRLPTLHNAQTSGKGIHAIGLMPVQIP